MSVRFRAHAGQMQQAIASSSDVRRHGMRSHAIAAGTPFVGTKCTLRKSTRRARVQFNYRSIRRSASARTLTHTRGEAERGASLTPD